MNVIIMMVRVLIIATCLSIFSNNAWSQKIKFRSTARIDTLNVWLSLPPKLDSSAAVDLRAIFDSLVSDFNNEPNLYKLKVNASPEGNALQLKMGPIRYVNTRRNIGSSLMNAALLTGTVYLLSVSGIIVPFLVFPLASSRIFVSLSADLAAKEIISKAFIGGNGYLLSKEKQQDRFLIGFEYTVFKTLNKAHKSYKRNLKRAAKRGDDSGIGSAGGLSSVSH